MNKVEFTGKVVNDARYDIRAKELLKMIQSDITGKELEAKLRYHRDDIWRYVVSRYGGVWDEESKE